MADKYTLRPTDLGSTKDDFVFRLNGRDAGRTYADSTPNGPRWYWSIYGINLRGPLPEGVVLQGLADDFEAAKAAFKGSWERLSREQLGRFLQRALWRHAVRGRCNLPERFSIRLVRWRLNTTACKRFLRPTLRICGLAV